MCQSLIHAYIKSKRYYLQGLFMRVILSAGENTTECLKFCYSTSHHNMYIWLYFLWSSSVITNIQYNLKFVDRFTNVYMDLHHPVYPENYPLEPNKGLRSDDRILLGVQNYSEKEKWNVHHSVVNSICTEIGPGNAAKYDSMSRSFASITTLYYKLTPCSINDTTQSTGTADDINFCIKVLSAEKPPVGGRLPPIPISISAGNKPYI